jgi:hypothetical protein
MIRTARGNADHAPLCSARAEEQRAGRAELPEEPTGVNVIEHRDDKCTLQIASGWQ